MAIPQAHNIAIVETIQPLPIQEISGLIRKETHTGEDVMKIVAERYQDILFQDLFSLSIFVFVCVVSSPDPYSFQPRKDTYGSQKLWIMVIKSGRF